MVAFVASVNVGALAPTAHSTEPVTGIDKRPVAGPVAIADPGPRGIGGSGVDGDHIADLAHHGGSDQAVYAYAREDLDRWQAELRRRLPNGTFGENLTTVGADVSGALVGARWRVGTCLLEVTAPRIPCRTFAGWLGEQGWVQRFTERAAPGAYLRIVEPGTISAGDAIVEVERPDHDLTIAEVFRIVTGEREGFGRLAIAGDALHAGMRADLARHRNREMRRNPGATP